MRKIFAANWKMYKNPENARAFIKDFSSLVLDVNSEIVIFPSAISLEAVCSAVRGSGADIKVGVQNAYFKNEGAFTGENSAEVAKQIGCHYVLIGHSERRSLFSESDSLLAQKVEYVQSLGLIPMLCIGETLTERESQKTKAVLEAQLHGALSKVDRSKALVIAYEPVWAIGTGKVATSEQVAETHTWVREILNSMDLPETAILYGGSVKPDNAADLIKQKHVSGFLVGGASLEPASFAKICHS